MGTIGYTGSANVDNDRGMSPLNLSVNKDTAPVNGWITEISMWLGNDPLGSVTADIAHVIYINGVRKYSSGYNNYSNTISQRTKTGLKVRMEDGDILRWGAMNRTDNHNPRLQVLTASGHQWNLYFGGFDDNYTSIPTSLPASPENTVTGEAFRGSLDYIANNTPSAPTYGASAPAAGATVNTTNPTIDYNLNHGNDADYDTSDSIQIQVYRADTNAMMLDSIFTPTSTENTNARFTRSYDSLTGSTPLTPGVTYKMEARHQDSWGAWSAWSSTRTFSIGPGPNAPTSGSMTPSGKIDAISGFNYVSTYTHGTGVAASAADLEVWNAAGTTRLYSTSVTGLSLTSGQVYTKAEWHADLTWGTSYSWRIRFKDANGLWGEWSVKKAFKTNSTPSAPTSLSPGSDAKYAGLTFAAIGTDPDNDDLTGAQIQITRVSDNVIVHDRTDTGITINNVSGEISYTLAGGTLVQNTAYKWRIRTKDQNFALQSWGPWSSYATFTFVTGATIGQVAPSAAQRLNLVRAPTPATQIAGDTQDYWTPSLTDATNTIEPLVVPDSPSGDSAAWEAVIAGKTLATSARLTSEMEPVDITKPYLFTIWVQRMNAAQTAGMYFNILCYNASSTLVGTIRPSDFGGALNNTNPSVSWTHYGGTIGMVGGTAWPAGTTQVKIEIIPSAVTAATMQFTGVLMEKLPTFASNSDWLNLKWWYGYFNGNTVIEPSRSIGYTWTGTPDISESTGVPILENLLAGVTPAYMSITYSHSVAKQADRLFIDQWISGRWVQAWDTGWITSTRTLIPLPQAVLRNEERFRLRLQVRDANLIVVEPTPVEVDVYYAGPPEIHITGVEEDATHGRITINLEDSTLSSDFGGIEIARSARGEPQKIIARLGSPSPKFYRYEAPASEREYTFKARQVQIVGVDRVQGRWNSQNVSVDYQPNMFIKDIEKPVENTVGFRLLQNDFQPDTKGAQETRHEIRGRKYPTIFTGEARSWTRELTMYLNDGHGFEESIKSRWDLLVEMDEDRPTVVVLDSYHKTKMIGKIVGESTFDLGIGRARRVTFNLEAVDYSEDYRDREGIL